VNIAPRRLRQAYGFSPLLNPRPLARLLPSPSASFVPPRSTELEPSSLEDQASLPVQEVEELPLGREQPLLQSHSFTSFGPAEERGLDWGCWVAHVTRGSPNATRRAASSSAYEACDCRPIPSLPRAWRQAAQVSGRRQPLGSSSIPSSRWKSVYPPPPRPRPEAAFARCRTRAKVKP